MTPSTLNEKTVPNIEVELIPAGNTKLSEGVHGSASRFPMTSGQQGIYLDFIQRPSLAYNVPAHYTFPAAPLRRMCRW